MRRVVRRTDPLRLGVLCLVVFVLGAADVRGQTMPDFSSIRSEIQSALVAWDAPSMAVAVAVDGEVVW